MKKRICKHCEKEFEPKSKTNIYCSKDCKAKATYKTRMSKLCPICRRSLIYVGSKRCSECANGKKYSQVSRSFAPSSIKRSSSKRRYKFKEFKTCPICKINKIIIRSNTTCSNYKCRIHRSEIKSNDT